MPNSQVSDNARTSSSFANYPRSFIYPLRTFFRRTDREGNIVQSETHLPRPQAGSYPLRFPFMAGTSNIVFMSSSAYQGWPSLVLGVRASIDFPHFNRTLRPKKVFTYIPPRFLPAGEFSQADSSWSNSEQCASKSISVKSREMEFARSLCCKWAWKEIQQRLDLYRLFWFTSWCVE